MAGSYFEALDYRTHEAISVEVREGKIANISKSEKKLNPSGFIAPGLVDLQVNGYQGVDLNQVGLKIADVEKLTRILLEAGTTCYFPTLISNSDEGITALLSVLSEACQANALVADCMGGVHLEGPFLSMEDGPRGAHSKMHIKAPDWKLFCEWQKAAGGRIRIITLSPEWPGSEDFIRKCVASGVVVSIGHTAANAEQIAAAVQAGATLSTHLGNATHLMLPRHPNYIWEQLANEHLWASVIADGFHLPDSVLKVFLKLKADQVFLVSDATSFAGLPPGSYSSHIGGEVELDRNGRLFMKNNPQLLAGSAQDLKWSVNYLVKANILSLQEAWDIASVQPKTFLYGRPVNELDVGKPADLVIFEKNDAEIRILKTIKSGEIIFQDH